MIEDEKIDEGDRCVIKVGHHTPDYRECVVEDGHFVHVLNPAWKLPVDSPLVQRVRRLGTEAIPHGQKATD